MNARLMLSGSAALALLLFLSLAPGIALGAEHPNHARGFRPEHPFDLGNLEHVNAFNGNLTLTIPIGQEYPLGPELSYGLTLTYTGNLWEWEEQCETADPKSCFLQSYPRESNAGLGWELSFGKITTKHDVYNNDSEPVYQGPDQGQHDLVAYRLHPDGESFTDHPELSFTQDGTYLRRNSNANTIEFPDGTVHEFGTEGAERIRDRFGSPPSNPANYLDVDYGNFDSVTGGTWALNDSHGRSHTITFGQVAGQAVVTQVELQAFGGATATYSFSYQATSVPRACNEPRTEGDISNAYVPLLTQVQLPDGSKFEMVDPSTNEPAYLDKAPTSGCLASEQNLNGSIERLDLPTGGRMEWSWELYLFPGGSSFFSAGLDKYKQTPFSKGAGVSERRRYDRSGSFKGGWLYSGSLTTFDDGYGSNREWVMTVIDPLGHYTKNYFSVYPGPSTPTDPDPPGGWTEKEYGLPFTRRVEDGTSGRYLSREVYDKTGTLLRTEYVRYERSGTDSKANPRVVSRRTVHDDPAGQATQWASVDSSDFDGLGHYRDQVFDGNFNVGENVRQVSTEYNPNRSIADIPDHDEPWVLDTYTKRTVQEGGQTRVQEACFDTATGFLKRTRSWASAAGRSGRDVVRQNLQTTLNGEEDDGFVRRERIYGGDGAGLATGALCSLSLAGAAYGRDNTYSCGAVETSSWTGTQFLAVDRTIDCSTGLASGESDPSGLTSTLTYDTLGRLTRVDPPPGEGADTVYTYYANGSLPARVTIQEKAGSTVLTQSETRLDGFGRVALERRLMPGGVWSERTTQRNALGLVTRRSEWEAMGDQDPSVTKIENFDAYRRPGKITLPDGHEISMTYEGVSRRTSKVPVWTRTTAGTLQELEAWTTEFYDRFGRLAAVEEPETSVRTNYSYDPSGNLSRVEMNTTSTPTQTRTFQYDGRGFLLSESHPELGTSVSYSQYDPLGNVGRVARGGWTLDYSYDSAGRLVSIDEPSTGRTWKEWLYATTNGTDPLTGGTDHRKGKLSSAIRHNWIVPPGGSSELEITVGESYTYAGVGGRISRVQTDVNAGGDPHFDYSVTYDQLGNVVSRSYPQCTDPDGSGDWFCTEASFARTVGQSFSRGMLTGVTGYASSISYHPNASIAQVDHGNGVAFVQDRDPDDMSRPARLRTVGASNDMDTGYYDYDGAGNVISMGSESYVYDLLSRVEEAELEVTATGCSDLVVPGGTQSGTAVHETCDTLTVGSTYTVSGTGNVDLRAGNRVVLDQPLSVQAGGYLKAEVDPALASGDQGTESKSQTYSYDLFGNLLVTTTQEGTDPAETRTIGTNSSTNRLSSAGYDSAGNVTSWGGTSYDYDPFNMLRHSTGYVYIYGPGDERIWVTDWSGGAEVSNWLETWTLRDLDGKPLRQFLTDGGNGTGNWSLHREYVWRGGTLLAAETPAGVRHFHPDHLGSPRLVTDAFADTVAEHRYYPYGEEASDPDQDAEVLKFTGHERDFLGSDPLDDLDYMHARYYSPHLGRFMSVDPAESAQSEWPQSWNRYGYALSSPLNYVDPDGKFPSPATLAKTATIAILLWDQVKGGSSFDVKAPVIGKKEWKGMGVKGFHWLEVDLEPALSGEDKLPLSLYYRGLGASGTLDLEDGLLLPKFEDVSVNALGFEKGIWGNSDAFSVGVGRYGIGFTYTIELDTVLVDTMNYVVNYDQIGLTLAALEKEGELEPGYRIVNGVLVRVYRPE